MLTSRGPKESEMSTSLGYQPEVEIYSKFVKPVTGIFLRQIPQSQKAQLEQGRDNPQLPMFMIENSLPIICISRDSEITEFRPYGAMLSS